MLVRQLMLTTMLASGALLLGVPTAGAQQNPSFNLINRSRLVIEHAYASPTGDQNWGPDRLGDDTVQPGQKYGIRLPADGNCMYDIRVEYVGGTSDERRSINTCNITDVAFPTGNAGQAPGPDNGSNPFGSQQPNTQNNPPPNNPPPGNRQQQGMRDPSFRIINRGQTAVNSVYASPVGDRNWGPDRLGQNVTIAGGANRIIRLPLGQCQYDVRIVFADNEAIEKRNVNLCEITDFPVH